MSRKFEIHISVHIVNNESKGDDDLYKIGYEVCDNDEDIIFTPTIFVEAFACFAKDEDLIYKVDPETLRHRLEFYQSESAVPPDVVTKIENIIKYIERHYDDDYIGVTIVYAEE
ncbi:Hypothetical predicted protein [Paramuricea clavata]|uniref:Uncharacterized protein n=1 Tax=Paramuricea clavata TaxID=317549 RepID=A0A6S7FFL6_PARCT|nr:Hypothetical predicted protein [Paramuricea clavata]